MDLILLVEIQYHFLQNLNFRTWLELARSALNYRTIKRKMIRVLHLLKKEAISWMAILTILLNRGFFLQRLAREMAKQALVIELLTLNLPQIWEIRLFNRAISSQWEIAFCLKYSSQIRWIVQVHSIYHSKQIISKKIAITWWLMDSLFRFKSNHNIIWWCILRHSLFNSSNRWVLVCNLSKSWEWGSNHISKWTWACSLNNNTELACINTTR